MRTAVHGSTERRITAIDHFFDVFHLYGTGMESIFNFLIMITEDLLKYIHKNIMREDETKRKPHPS